MSNSLKLLLNQNQKPNQGKEPSACHYLSQTCFSFRATQGYSIRLTIDGTLTTQNCGDCFIEIEVGYINGNNSVHLIIKTKKIRTHTA